MSSKVDITQRYGSDSLGIMTGGNKEEVTCHPPEVIDVVNTISGREQRIGPIQYDKKHNLIFNILAFR